MAEQFKTYLFEYPYEGSRWCFNILAASQEDAMARLRALGWAEYRGELYETIPASSPRALLVPLIVRWKNWRRA